MSKSAETVFSSSPPDPLAPLGQLAAWLLSAFVHVVVGLALGMLAARMMRRRHLHWSWAAGWLACVLAVRPALAAVGSTLEVSAASAAWWSWRWHREDLQAGGDLASFAANLSEPVDALRRLARRLELRCREARGTVRWFRRDQLVIGRDARGRTVSVPLGGAPGGTHTLVVGATGSGKTVTQAWIAARAIEHGMGAVVVDPKGDPAMRTELHRAALSAGAGFIEWTPTGPSIYNPYARGSETEIADKALAGERFTEPHYLRQAQRYLGHAVRALRHAGRDVSLGAIVELLDPARLEVLARELPEGDAQDIHDYLDSLTPRQRADLSGVRDRLAIITESDVGRWLDPSTVGVQRFDLLQSVRSRAVVYFDLDADSRPLLTQMLGAAIVQDLQTTVAAMQDRPLPTVVVIDEFSALAAEQIVRLFGRARSAGCSLVLSTQELADLRPMGRERVLEQVMGNLSVLIAHRQVVPDSARLIGSLAGTKGAWRTSRHSDGRTTRTRTRDAVLEPDQITRLECGWAAVLTLAHGGAVSIARVFSPARRA